MKSNYSSNVLLSNQAIALVNQPDLLISHILANDTASFDYQGKSYAVVKTPCDDLLFLTEEEMGCYIEEQEDCSLTESSFVYGDSIHSLQTLSRFLTEANEVDTILDFCESRLNTGEWGHEIAEQLRSGEVRELRYNCPFTLSEAFGQFYSMKDDEINDHVVTKVTVTRQEADIYMTICRDYGSASYKLPEWVVQICNQWETLISDYETLLAKTYGTNVKSSDKANESALDWKAVRVNPNGQNIDLLTATIPNGSYSNAV